MDDPVIYLHFLRNMLRLAPPRIVQEMVSFADTFCSLLSNSEKDFDEFVKRTHQSNSACTNNALILIPSTAILSIRAILFDLKDRETCDALRDLPTLQAMDGNTMCVLRAQHNAAKALADGEHEVALSDSMEVVKLTQKNY